MAIKRKEIAWKDLMSMEHNHLMSKTFLEGLGFDPNREVIWYNDYEREVVVLRQDVGDETNV